jgi:hypothetical protein
MWSGISPVSLPFDLIQILSIRFVLRYLRGRGTLFRSSCTRWMPSPFRYISENERQSLMKYHAIDSYRTARGCIIGSERTAARDITAQKPLPTYTQHGIQVHSINFLSFYPCQKYPLVFFLWNNRLWYSTENGFIWTKRRPDHCVLVYEQCDSYTERQYMKGHIPVNIILIPSKVIPCSGIVIFLRSVCETCIFDFT